MLFNSYEFIFLFLPATLAVFFLLGSRGLFRAATAWLTGASFFYYAWWNPAYLWLLGFSILFNYSAGRWLVRGRSGARGSRAGLWLGVAVNLGFLGYFKYANFFVDNANALFGLDWGLGRIVLPLAISFFTFQQIAFLVDSWRGETLDYGFLDYCLFVTFFPQLIAGPIVHHREMFPQFGKGGFFRFESENLAVGLTIFVVGLFKKVVVADGVAVFASPVFAAADAGQAVALVEAWTGALAYTFQLYFDFSGYSDMAIGLGRMFGLRLPLNFDSPYKAANIMDFWRRWHITLSRFLRDYLYIPLGGNRKGKTRRYANLMATMVLGGLWHGAGWTFVFWGALHGLYLMINHAWRGRRAAKSGSGGRFWPRALTFLAVVLAWVFFRAETFGGALSMLQGMAGLNGLVLPEGWQDKMAAWPVWVSFAGPGNPAHDFWEEGGFYWLTMLLLITQLAPNTRQIMAAYRPALETYRTEDFVPRFPAGINWRPDLLWAVLTAGLALTTVFNLSHVSEFLYFNF